MSNENVTNEVVVKEEKRIVITAKGFNPLGEKGVANLLKNCNDFLATGKVVWSMADYMGITGAGKGAEKYGKFIQQLENNSDLPVCVELKEKVSQVIMAMQNGAELVIEKPALRAYFSPLFKIRADKAEAEKVVETSVEENVEI